MARDWWASRRTTSANGNSHGSLRELSVKAVMVNGGGGSRFKRSDLVPRARRRQVPVLARSRFEKRLLAADAADGENQQKTRNASTEHPCRGHQIEALPNSTELFIIRSNLII
ncbi:hypothetical protein KCP74_22700 [Salmonella enterica subsp. enterica]|nr:hypothetical protein KCP74_22700 [Salmonella enterica subsp. enterica]